MTTPPRKHRILLIEDEELVRASTKRILGRLGHEVIVAENGAIGVDLVRASPHGYDLVLLDMAMPVMGGAECFRHLREIAPELPVVICSGYARTKDTQAMLDHGALAFLEKPYRLEMLKEILDRVFSA